MAAFNYHNPFRKGQTVTIKGTGNHGIVTGAYTYQGRVKLNVRTSLMLPAFSYEVHELAAYTVQPCDHVIVRDNDHVLWSFEVMDLKADNSAVLFKRADGSLDWCPMGYIIAVIPFENVPVKA